MEQKKSEKKHKLPKVLFQLGCYAGLMIGLLKASPILAKNIFYYKNKWEYKKFSEEDK